MRTLRLLLLGGLAGGILSAAYFWRQRRRMQERTLAGRVQRWRRQAGRTFLRWGRYATHWRRQALLAETAGLLARQRVRMGRGLQKAAGSAQAALPGGGGDRPRASARIFRRLRGQA